MQTQIFQSEPNLIAETYRNQTNLQLPRRIEKHFDFIETSCDGLFLLGTSSLSGRIWSGSVWAFEEYPGTPDIENCLAGIEFESSVASGLWLDNNKKVAIGCDSGSLHYLSLSSIINKKKSHFMTDGIITEHDDSIVSLDIMRNKTKMISGSMDRNIKVWDLETLSSDKSYSPAHGHLVTSVSSMVDNISTFVSTSLDGNSLLWDIRLEKPASLILHNKCGFTASAWIDQKCISIGSNNGSVSLVDLRMKNEFDRNLCAKRPIFRIKYSKECEQLAVCADDPIVRVFSCKEGNLTNVYESDEHKDFVRGLAWDNSTNNLYSCGWDSKILCHKVAPKDSEEVNEKNDSQKEEK